MADTHADMLKKKRGVLPLQEELTVVYTNTEVGHVFH